MMKFIFTVQADQSLRITRLPVAVMTMIRFIFIRVITIGLLVEVVMILFTQN